MDRAFDTFQNQLAYAVDCERGDYFPDRFICPCCGENVIFAAGVVHTAHFRHHWSAPECENRVAGMAQGPFADIESEPRDASLVALFSNRGSQPECSFSLRYRPAADVDSIAVRMGPFNLSYQLHGRREIDVPVSAPAEEFCISAMVSGHVMFRRTVQAFSGWPALFRHTAARAVRVPEGRCLHPGQYIACFSPDAPLQFPLVCEPRQIGCSLGITVISFNIPDHINARVMSFCHESLGRTVRVRPFSYAILEPMALTEEAPDIWSTSAEGEAVILLGSKIRGTRNTLTVQYRDKARLLTHTNDVVFGEKPHALRFSIGKHQPLIRVGVGTPIQFIAELRYLESLPEPGTTRFRFHFPNESDGTTFQICRSSWQLPQMLAEVREGSLTVASIDYPQYISVELVTATARIPLPRETGGETLTNLLRESKAPIWIDARGYPPILIPYENAPPRRSKKVSPCQIRRRPLRSRLRQAAAYRLGVGSRYSFFQ